MLGERQRKFSNKELVFLKSETSNSIANDISQHKECIEYLPLFIIAKNKGKAWINHVAKNTGLYLHRQDTVTIRMNPTVLKSGRLQSHFHSFKRIGRFGKTKPSHHTKDFFCVEILYGHRRLGSSAVR